jgi:ATPase subunit of ABC transporter with duplicated ATPase domains
VDFALSEGQRVAIVGPNGSGKSTLLSVLAGKDVGREDGELWMRKDLNLAFLEQEPPFDPELGVLEAVYARDTPLMQLLRRYDRIMADAAAGDINEAKMAEVLEQMDALEAWDTETKAHAALDKLGCAEFLTRKMGELSGGQRKRVALAAALIEEPDMLVLDEPTNHLSVEGVEWLEKRLQQMTNTATLLVSHDRAFIDAVCSDILELDGTGGSHRHRGGYAAYLEGREQRWAAEAQAVAAAKNTLRKEQEWMRRQPKARATKEKARIERFYSLTERAANKGSKAKTVDLVESKVSRMGDVIVEFDDASLAFYGDDGEPNKKILDRFSYAFSKGEKIGLVGPNGAGKTTFLKTIMGEIELDSGWVSVGETIQFGYYSQIANFRDENLTVVEFVREIESEASCAVGGFGGNGGMTAYKLLERFNFAGAKQMTKIKDLSGGEQRRLQLLSVLALCPNFLILDEPTNDLDLDTIEALEEALEDFDGCVLVVSHDRAFVDNLVDHIFVFDGKGGIDDWNGDYSALRRYLKKMDDERLAAKALGEKNGGRGDPDAPELTEEELAEQKARRQRERDVLKEAHNAPSVIDKIERALAVLEQDIEAIDKRMLACGSDVSAAQEVQLEKDAKTAKQDLYMAEWERLEGVLAEAEAIKAEQAAREEATSVSAR